MMKTCFGLLLVVCLAAGLSERPAAAQSVEFRPATQIALGDTAKVAVNRDLALFVTSDSHDNLDYLLGVPVYPLNGAAGPVQWHWHERKTYFRGQTPAIAGNTAVLLNNGPGRGNSRHALAYRVATIRQQGTSFHLDLGG